MTEKTESMFSLRYAVQVDVIAPAPALWARLTNAKGFPSWNSTVTEIGGEIALGNKLAIRVPIAPDRVFSPKVVEFVPDQRMVWRDGFAPMFQGTRTYTLTTTPNGTTFSMVEQFSGIMLPMIKGSLPDFRPVFDQYAADLKRECEATGSPA